MADKKISQLTAATSPIAGTDVLPLVQSGQTVKVPANQLLSFGSANGVVYLNGSNIATAGTSLVFNGSQLGVGVAPSAKLHVYAGANNEAVRLDAASTYNTGINWYSNGVIKWAMQLLGDGTDAFRMYNFNTGADAVVVDSSSNLKISAGNLVQGTAAKGVNFTANTPAAGMTSQLLNWYEEGTWTPVVSASSGTITSYTATGKYTRIGRSVVLSFKITITTNGTGAGTLFVDGVPYNAAAASSDGGAGRESANTGYGFVMTFGTTSRLYVNKADASYPGANGDILAGTITYTV